MRLLDRIANISIIVAVVVFLFVIGRHELLPPISQQQAQRLSEENQLVGKSIQVPGVQFPRNHELLMFALSTKCPYCRESLPFYEELTEKIRGKDDLIAVFPQTQEQAQIWLKAANISVSQIVSARLDAFGISATPSLLLLDKSGKVERVWVGRLNAQGQAQLLSYLLR